jgi:hypothetical protein
LDISIFYTPMIAMYGTISGIVTNHTLSFQVVHTFRSMNMPLPLTEQTKTHFILSQTEMGTLFKIISDKKMGDIPTSGEQFEKAMLTLWGFVLCDPDWFKKDGNKIQPTAYAIPKKQWLDISRWLSEYSNQVTRVSVTMQWVNIGPSAYDEEE